MIETGGSMMRHPFPDGFQAPGVQLVFETDTKATGHFWAVATLATKRVAIVFRMEQVN